MPQISGQISGIYVQAGDRVKQGQLLMVIDKRKQEAALNSDKASLSSAKATLYSLEVQRKSLLSNLDLNKKMYERYKNLYSKNTVSKQDLEKYTDAYNKAEYDLEANEAQIRVQKSETEKALFAIKEQEVQLTYYKITAPYAGIVGDIPVKVGNYVDASSQLLSVTKNNPLEINVGLPTEKVFDIKIGLPVEVLDNNDNVTATSAISFISPKINTETQTILVKAILNNPKEILKADQSVKVKIIYDKTLGITVPASAIAHMGGQDFAYIINLKDKKAFVKQQPVKLGGIQEGKYVVLAGLNKGDEIVSGGIQKLADGAPVTIIGKGK
jgi:RND family efflux transporter MFP subunit